MDRRSFLGAAASASVGAALIAKTWNESGKGSSSLEPFSGHAQVGIATPQQAHASFVGLNLRPGVDAAALGRLLRLWKSDSQLLMSGRPAMGDSEGTLATASTDLTITFGFGFNTFQKTNNIESWPFVLQQIPDFATDRFDAKWQQTDLIIQVCADDALRVHHAARELILGAKPFAELVWQQNGFLPTSEVALGQTPRNLMGQKDGTANFKTHSADFAQTVWAQSPDWFKGGTSLILRRISMDLDKWETLSPELKSKSVGRDIETGAPLGSSSEFDSADFEKRDHHGLAIPADAHMRRARVEGTYLHRRGYNFLEAGDQGLLFAAFARDPQQFVDIQQRLSALDSLNTWTTAIGSGLYAVPPDILAVS
jgi:dye decolorizing peroxidase